jgi:chemotaxis protein methyltransferase CheR
VGLSQPPTECGNAVAWAGPRLTIRERQEFQALIHRETGISLADSKHELIASRLSSRLRHLGLSSYGEYYRRVTEQDPDGTELRELIDRITTNKTSFFRERHHFDFLGQRARTALGPGGRLRIWSSACSSGEEPYSIAMTLADHGLRDLGATILASDISTRVLRQAETGVYDQERLEGIPAESLRRHFLRGKGSRAGQYRVRPELRQRIAFRRINLSAPDWPIDARFDIIFCRNVLIYFGREMQERLLQRFAEVLEPGGHLVLGHSENLSWMSRLFQPVGQTVYRLVGAVARSPEPSRGAAPEPATRIIVGQVKASRVPRVLSTVLGSCVAACLYDPVARIGGMNHFLLPEGDAGSALPSRYGVHAMELLINEIMKLGGDRRRLQAKAFGGASSEALGLSVQRVAEQNAAFVRRFLAVEGIPLVAERLGGHLPLDVRLHTDSGRVQVRALDPAGFAQDPLPSPHSPVAAPGGAVTLF